MFTIQLQDVGKRFNKNWIFKNLDLSFHSGKKYAILGPNGSGKSTLMQCIAGYQSISKGKIEFNNAGQTVEEESKYKHLALASPFLELVEEFTLQETLSFHFKMKDLAFLKEKEEILEITGLQSSAHKQIKFFSSGMKQRVKIALAVFSDVPVLMLDEPCTNFDTKGTDWYLDLMERHTTGRLVLVASNQEVEYSFCDERIQLSV